MRKHKSKFGNNRMLETLESRLLMAIIGVTNNDDAAEGSLRAAIDIAEPGDTISLAAISGQITLASQLSISKDLTIEGPGTAELTISGDDAVRVFDIWSETNVTISGLTVTHGLTGDQAAASTTTARSRSTMSRSP